MKGVGENILALENADNSNFGEETIFYCFRMHNTMIRNSKGQPGLISCQIYKQAQESIVFLCVFLSMLVQEHVQ